MLEDEERQIEKKNGEEDRELREHSMTALDVLAQASIAVKTVDLLGQILRNYYGSLRLTTKLDIGKDASDLALRAMYSFAEVFVTQNFQLVDLFAEMRRKYEDENVKVSARLNNDELQRWARDFVFALLGGLAEAIVRKVAEALGWEQLKPTLDALVRENGSLTYRMVKMAALLDGPGAIPRSEIDAMVRDLNDNPLGFQILRDLVSQRVYRYPTEFGDRQWCQPKAKMSPLSKAKMSP